MAVIGGKGRMFLNGNEIGEAVFSLPGNPPEEWGQALAGMHEWSITAPVQIVGVDPVAARAIDRMVLQAEINERHHK